MIKKLLISAAITLAIGLTVLPQGVSGRMPSSSSAFAAKIGADEPSVQQAVAFPNGKILIVGGFSSYNGSRAAGVARLKSNGTFDAGFRFLNEDDSGATPNSAAPLPDGKVLVGFTDGGGLRRLNGDGSLDTSFSSTATDGYSIEELVPLSSGKVLIGGDFGVARVNSTGSIDWSTTDEEGTIDGEVYSVKSLADGKVLIAGDFESYRGAATQGVARLNSNGTLDVSFTGRAVGGAGEGLVALPGGKVLISSPIEYDGEYVPGAIIRLNSDGSLDRTFRAPSTIKSVNDAAVLPDGKVLVGGDGVWRLNTDGSDDSTFRSVAGGEYDGDIGEYDVGSVVALSSGKVLIGGIFSKYDGIYVGGIARLTSTGSLDATFNPGGQTVRPPKPDAKWSSSAKAKTVTAVITPVAGVTYTLTATSGRITKKGSCKNVTIKQGKKKVARRSCTVKLAKGKWLATVTPKKGSISGTVNSKSYSFK